MTEAAESVKAVAPGRSSRPLPRRPAGSTFMLRTTATTATGRFTRKIACQPNPWVRSPPSIGPAAAAAPLTAPHTPNAVLRSRPW